MQISSGGIGGGGNLYRPVYRPRGNQGSGSTQTSQPSQPTEYDKYLTTSADQAAHPTPTVANRVIENKRTLCEDQKAKLAAQAPDSSQPVSHVGIQYLSNLLKKPEPCKGFTDLLIIVQMERLEVYNAKINFMINKIEKRNNHISIINNIIQKARDSRPNETDQKAVLPREVRTFMVSKNLEVPGESEQLTPEKYDQYVLSVKGILDDENNDAQLDMTRMQRQINYRNQVYDTMVSYLSKVLRLRETITANLK